MRTEIEAWLKKRVRPIAPLRDEADAILVFEAADRLDCGGCEDPAIRWHWWGFVFAADGRELASL
ncbi:MAG: hypothetical protein VYE73_17990, partial [Acidobacteriota bacterium]|nr:hypothetical protein [Acidobacteriota bacterium]